jgi:hypothetical protein
MVRMVSLMSARPGAFGDGDELLRGLDIGLPLAADMRGVQAAALGHHPGQGDDLLRIRPAAGDEYQPRGHPPGALLQRFAQQPLHGLDLLRVGQARIRAHGALAKLVVSRQLHIVHPRLPLLYCIQVIGHVPGPVGVLVEHRLLPAERARGLLFERFARLALHRRGGAPAVARHGERAALHQQVQPDGVLQHAPIGVAMDIHPARRNTTAGAVDNLRRLHVAKVAQEDDAPALQAHVGPVPWRAQAIDDHASAE